MKCKINHKFDGTINGVHFDNEILYYGVQYILDEFENGTLQDMYTIACYVTARYMLQGLAMGMTKEEMKKQLEKLPIYAAQAGLKLKQEDEENGK